MTIDGVKLTLQVANDPAERETGLMHVAEMPADHGMIFVFPRPGRLGFWMKDTLIPLDIVYLDAAGRVLNVERMEPGDETLVPSAGRAQWAIELNAGRAAELKIAPGDRLIVPAMAWPEYAR